MKKIQLIIICLLFTLSKTNAQITIGTETVVNKGIPVHPLFEYTYSQNIYLASELGASGNIYTLTYYVSPTTNLANSNSWTIYMGQNNYWAFSTSSWVSKVNLTQVFSGNVTVSGGMVNIILDTPFYYNGTDNLVIAVDENAPGSDGSGNSFYSSSVVGNRAIVYSGTSNPDPLHPPTATSVASRVANVTLGGISPGGPAPSQLYTTSVTKTSGNLGWTENGTATNWNIQWGLAGFAFGTGNMLTGVTSNTYNFSGLNPGYAYQFYVQAVDTILGESSWSNPFTFATYGIPQFKFHLAFEDATGAKDTLWLIWDSLATGNYDTIFGEKPVSLLPNAFQVYYCFGDTLKVRADNTINGGTDLLILAKNYTYPLTMYWDSSLIYHNNLPFTIGHAYLDNEWFFFNNDGSLIEEFNMMQTNSVLLPKFYYWSQEQFPLHFSMGYGDLGISIKEEKNKDTWVKIYPNPVFDKLVVELKDKLMINNQFQLIDINGKLLKQRSFSSNKISVDLSNLSKGIYFIEVFNNNFSYRKKIIKY